MKTIFKSLLVITFLTVSTISNTKAGNHYSCNEGNQCQQCCGCDNCGYIFAYGGFTGSNDLSGNSYELGGGAVPSNFATVFDYDGDFIAGGGVGVYSSCFCGSRFEIEGLYSEQDLTSVTANGTNIPGYSGALKSKAIYFNALKEIPMGCFTGYVGGGCGVTHNNFSFRNRTLFAGNLEDSGEDSALSCQFIAGVDVPVSECVALFFQYKLMAVGEMEFDCVDPNAAAAFQRKTVTMDSYLQNAFVVGARVCF